ncbi:hypothetical protein HMPREF9370_0628 [Neisseria wadsworthii 9715]|uniref:Uncharacterized protein n=1 Tax=Neisseria wadsworthii 9715 TaxID=1030841 RepID=G4CNG9_9NEIS|nr:hypothetical protein HMPREF9370_0628 [Neisseria wadsworthii 9715]
MQHLMLHKTANRRQYKQPLVSHFTYTKNTICTFLFYIKQIKPCLSEIFSDRHGAIIAYYAVCDSNLRAASSQLTTCQYAFT